MKTYELTQEQIDKLAEKTHAKELRLNPKKANALQSLDEFG